MSRSVGWLTNALWSDASGGEPERLRWRRPPRHRDGHRSPHRFPKLVGTGQAKTDPRSQSGQKDGKRPRPASPLPVIEITIHARRRNERRNLWFCSMPLGVVCLLGDEPTSRATGGPALAMCAASGRARRRQPRWGMDRTKSRTPLRKFVPLATLRSRIS